MTQPLDPSQLIARLDAALPDAAILARHADDLHPRVDIHADAWRDVAQWLRHDEAVAMDWLACLTAVDYVVDDKLAIVCDLRSSRYGNRFAVKVFTDRAEPVIPSVADLWPAADWHEREAFDLMGIGFPGHPDLRRILLPEDWKGHPLRKDYVFPRQYHDIPGSYELDWQQRPDYPT